MYCRYAEKIGDYYTSLTTDKRFVILENGEWDIRDNHVLNIFLEEDVEEDIDDLAVLDEEEIGKEK